MRSYQSVLILKPDLDETHVDGALEKVNGFFKKSGGACLKVEKWGKKRLSYKVRKNRFGYYLNIYHTCENAKVPVLENDYKLLDSIIKFLVIRLEDDELERALGRESIEDEKESEENKKDTSSPQSSAEADNKENEDKVAAD